MYRFNKISFLYNLMEKYVGYSHNINNYKNRYLVIIHKYKLRIRFIGKETGNIGIHIHCCFSGFHCQNKIFPKEL